MKGNVQKKTQISELGEFGLIEHLKKGIKLINPSSKKGVGDDAAVLEYPDKQIVVTTQVNSIELKARGWNALKETSKF